MLNTKTKFPKNINKVERDFPKRDSFKMFLKCGGRLFFGHDVTVRDCSTQKVLITFGDPIPVIKRAAVFCAR